MEFKWRKWNRVIHRDFGYVFFAMTVIYCISGIAINHIGDWNPNYMITIQEFEADLSGPSEQIDKTTVMSLLKSIGEEKNYKKHYFPANNQLKVFLDGGNVIYDLDSGSGTIEKIKRRPVLHAMNFLHYNPGKWWTLFSDIFSVALILIAITGLLILKGRNGITRRGAILTIAGIIIPIVYLALFY